MGWFNRIYEKAKKVVSNVATTVSNTVKKVWDRMTGAGEKRSTTIGERDEYDRREIDNVVDYASLATEYMNEISDEVDEIEKDCISVFKAHLENFLEDMEPDDIAEIYRKFEEQITSLQGTVRMYVNSKCSSDNRELCEILEMPKGREKKKKAREYQDKIVNDAINNLCKEIPKRIEIMKAFIKQHFDKRIATVDLVMQGYQKECEELKKHMESTNFDDKKIVLASADMITQCDYLLHELNN